LSSVGWLASYPKSGSTWTRAMLANFLLDHQLTTLGNDLDDAVPDYPKLLLQGRMVPLGDSRLVIAKTHFLPQKEVMQEYRELTGKIICLVRNPRDIILSAARMLRIPEAKRGLFAKDFIAHRGVSLWVRRGWGTWQQSVQEWTSPAVVRQYFPGAEMLTVRYEDIRADPTAALHSIVGFLDLDGSDDSGRVERAVENASQARMRALEQEFVTSGVNAFTDISNRDPFVGKGLTDQSLSGLGEDVEAAYQQWQAEDEEFRLCVKQFGYESRPAPA